MAQDVSLPIPLRLRPGGPFRPGLRHPAPRYDYARAADPLAGAQFDAITGFGPVGVSTTQTWAHVVGDFPNRVLYVTVEYNNDPGGTPTATYNGVSMGAPIASRASVEWSYTWELVAPDVGSHNVVVTSSIARSCAAAAWGYYNVDPNNPHSGLVTETDGDEQITVASTGNGRAVFSLSEAGGTDTAPSGLTERIDQLGSGGGRRMFVGDVAGTGSNITAGWGAIGSSTFHVGFNVNAAPLLRPLIDPNPMLSGKGMMP